MDAQKQERTPAPSRTDFAVLYHFAEKQTTSNLKGLKQQTLLFLAILSAGQVSWSNLGLHMHLRQARVSWVALLTLAVLSHTLGP